MGAPELHLKRYRVAGESMDFSLRTGDSLWVEPLSRGARERLGDLALFMGRSKGLLLLHRVLARLPLRNGPVLTKGDFHFFPDGLIPVGARIGVARALERGGLRIRLDTPAARLAGMLLAAYSLPAVLLYRCAQLGLWILRTALLPSPWMSRPPGEGVLVFLETAHLSLLRPALRWLPDRVWGLLARDGDRCELPAGREGPSEIPGGGELRGKTEWSGEVSVFGDVVVLPGAELVLRPGTRVRFRSPKRFHHGLRRRWTGKFHDLSGPRSCRFIVYGKLRLLGAPGKPVRIEDPDGLWGGLLLLGRGRTHVMRRCVLSGAGIRLLGGARLSASELSIEEPGDEALRLAGRSRAVVEKSVFSGGAIGIAAGELSAVSLTGCSFSGQAVAVCAKGQSLARLEGCRLEGPGPDIPDSTGLRAEDWSALQIRGCSAEGFSAGVLVRGTAAADVVGSRLSGNGIGAFGEERGRLRLRWSKLLRSRSHGLWVKDRAGLSMLRCWVSRAGRNAAYASGGARLLVSDSLLSSAACGVVAGGARAVLLGTRLRGSREHQLHAGAGALSAARCELRGGLHGARIDGGARARLSDCRFAGSDAAVMLAGEASARLSGCRLEARLSALSEEDAAQAELQGCSLCARSGSGIRCSGGSSLSMKGSKVSACADNGISGTGNARLSLEDCEVRKSRRGLACGDAARSRSAGCRFIENAREQAVLSGGEHHFEGCDLSRGTAGLSLGGGARAELSATRFASNSAVGLSCGDGSSAELCRCVIERNALGAELSGRSRLDCRESILRENEGHGLWLRGGSQARLETASFISNADNGLYLTGGSRAELAKTEFQRNRCGAAAAENACLEAESCELDGNERIGFSFEGGRHRVSGCGISRSSTGLALSADARLSLHGSRVDDCAELGLLLAGSSEADSEESAFGSNGVGAELRGGARLRAARCRFTRSRSQGLLTGGEARAELEDCALLENGEEGAFLGGGGARLLRCAATGNRRGLVCAETASCTARDCRFGANAELGIGLKGGKHEFVSCELTGGKLGLEAAGRAACLMESCELRGQEDSGLRLGGESEFELRGLRVRENRIAFLAAGRCRSSCTDGSFIGSALTHAELLGGIHRFTGCRFEGAPLGVSIRGDAEASLRSSVISGGEEAGLTAGDRSRVEADGVEFDRNGIGIRALGSALLRLRGGRISGSAGHGLAAGDSVRVRLSEIEVSGNRDNGLFIEGGARAGVSDARFEANGCGISCAGDAALRACRCTLDSNTAMGLSLCERSAALLRDVRIEGSPAGASLGGDSRGVFLRACVLRTEKGVQLLGKARASFIASCWGCSEVGLWGQEGSFARIKGGAFRGHFSEALRLSQSAGARVRGVRFSRNCMGVLLEESGSAWIAGCVFRVNPTGVKADGSSALTMRRSRLRDCLLDGVWLGPGASGDLLGNGFFGNRIGLHRHHTMSPRLGGNVFLRNAYGDKRRFPEEELV